MRYLMIALTVSLASAASAEDVTLRFEVEVPRNTPDNAIVFVTGSLPQFGPWQPDALPLRRREDGRHVGQTTVAAGQVVQFKFTLGSWEGVEKSAAGAEIANRTEVPRSDTVAKAKVERWNRVTPPPPRAPTLTGDVRVLDDYESAILGGGRTLRIYLPPGYDAPASAAQRYPVLYLLDGQNLFDEATSVFGVEWSADEAAERLIAEGAIPPLIMVGIDNAGAGRIHEYTPVPGDVLDLINVGGGGADFSRALLEEIKPLIDARFRTRPDRAHTAVGGSSLGGLMSLYLLYGYPDTFAAAAVVSPALWWSDSRIIGRISADPTPLAGARLWLDTGTREGLGNESLSSRQMRSARALAEILEREATGLGVTHRYVEVEGAEHNEAAWAARFPDILRFLFAEASEPEPVAEPE
ncbi:MAG: alpha/beta hydrolase-fold protein [Planctomycetota bacterium]